MTEEEKTAYKARLDADIQKEMDRLGVNSPGFFARHEDYMAECDRIQEEMRKDGWDMPKRRDETMLRVDSLRFALAIGRAELEPVELAQKAGVSPNAVYTAAKGYLIKPLKLGKMARAMNVPLEDLIVASDVSKVKKRVESE